LRVCTFWTRIWTSVQGIANSMDSICRERESVSV
jgi:hypothetical protein